jgi:hypothetical protein
MLKRIYFMLLVLLGGIVTAQAVEETYSPVLDVNFRTASANTSWQTVKNAADEGNNDFELTYTAGFFALQKYTVADLQNASKLVLTLTVGKYSGVDAVRLWAFTKNDWTAESGIDDIVGLVETSVGIAPRATEGTANTPLVTGAKVSDSDPAKATFTITGTALATIKANAASDGTFTLLLTNDKLTDTGNKRSYLSNNTANDEANRPTLVATIETPTVINTTTGVGYSTLKDAFDALTDADTELEVYEDQTLTSRLTWNKAYTLTITPKADITIKGHTNQMWFLTNADNASMVIGNNNYTITFDGQNNAMGAYPITKREKKSNITLTNVVFQNFDLNNSSALCQGANADGVMTLENITVTNCNNPAKGFFYNERVVNDKVVLKGYMNIDAYCTGTSICATAEYKSDTQVNGRIKVDDNNFTASNTITIDWLSNNTEKDVFVAGVSVVVGVTSNDIANCFALTGTEWTLTRVNNDLKLAAPVEPTAQIGSTTYADLAAAMAAVQDGETITLLADQDVSSRINVKNMSITIAGNYAIKRASGYKNGLLFLTQKPDEGYATGLTLDGVTLDGKDVEATAAMIEAGNNGTTILKDVTVQNVNTTADAAIINKGGGKLTLNGVTFTNCTATKADVFDGNSVTLKGANTISSIYVEKKLVLKADNATATAPIKLIVETANRSYGLLVEDGDATQFTCDDFRLSQQQDGVYAMPLAVAGSFSHPSLLHTSSDIAAVQAKLTANDALATAAYARLEAQSGGSAAGAVEYLKRMDQANWESTYPDYSNFTRAATDAKLAYELALRYQLKGSTAAANAAVNILNDWATNNNGMLRLKGYNNNIPDPNEYLICIQAYQFANAAELLRDYSGWTAADFAQFQNWIRQTFADVAILFLENHHNNENALHYWLNWDLAALNAMLSVGILCDDQALVDYALAYPTSGAGTGNINNAVVAIHDDPNSNEKLAQCQESGRDQGHSTLDITLLGVLCQTAQNIGTDLFTLYSALEMAEYVGKYNLMDGSDQFVYTSADVPFTAYDNGEVNHTAISADARGTVRPCWELFYAYAKNNDKDAAYTSAWVKYKRAKNAWGEGEGTSTDELGFGTLMFAAVDQMTLTVTDAGAATLVLPFGAALPMGVKAYTLNYTAGASKVTATEVTAITANQPVLINAEAGNYVFTSNGTTNANSPVYGALNGVFATTVVPSGAYILSNKGGVVGFYKADGSTNTVAANHAYLTADGAGASLLTLDINSTTGVNDVRSKTADERGEIYNLNGQRVVQPTKGLYIVNGKKVMIK